GGVRGGGPLVPAERALQRELAAPPDPRLVRGPRRRPLPAVAPAGGALVLRGVAPLGLPPPLSGRPARREPDPRRRRPRPLHHRRPRDRGAEPPPRRPAARGDRGKAVQPPLGGRQERPLLRPGRAER